MKLSRQSGIPSSIAGRTAKIIAALKEYLFPVYCLGCDREGVWLCENCLARIPVNGIFCCPVCHQGNRDGVCCAICRPRSHLDRLLAVCPYREDSLPGKIIQYFKYYYAQELRTAMAEMIRDFLPRLDLSAVTIVIPVPLHKKRQAERGFNQAEAIARILAEHLRLPLLSALNRRKYTRQQAKLDREERQQNVKEAFAAVQSVAGETALLVDDVFTTGSTMQEAAKVLREAGAEQIIGFALARG